MNGCIAQHWELINRLEIENVDQLSQDQQGNVYISNFKGDIFKYDKDGILIQEYSPQTQGRCNQIDAISALKVLVFYEEYQEFVLLDRYLSNDVRYRLASIDFGYISHVSLTMLQSVWMVDASDFSLKLWNATSRTLEENKSLVKVLNEDNADISGLYTYQNRTYLLDRNSGIYIFDIIGNFMQFVPGRELSSVGFFENQMYFRDGEQLIVKNLYKDGEITLPLMDNLNGKILYQRGRLYHFEESQLEIYSYLSGD